MNHLLSDWLAAPPPQSVTLGDLSQLSLRACVAYAVRCAMRIRPRFQIPADHPAVGHERAVDQAIALAVSFARAAAVDSGDVARAAEFVYRLADATADVTYYSGFAAAHAAQAASTAAAVRELASDGVAIEVVASAFGASRVLEGNSQLENASTVVGAMRSDLEKLLALRLGAFAELGQAIDPTEEGPLGVLWPLGEPAWYHGS